jgi:predicted DNA-binding transcriptional regulator AlpA
MQFLTSKHLIAMLKISRRKFEYMVQACELPPHIKVGRSRRWGTLEINAWLASRMDEARDARKAALDAKAEDSAP